jgi:DNA-binding NarL/FixJ family response regulator
MFTGHVRQELIERSLDAGAWGYVSKHEGADVIVDAVRAVARGQIYLGREVEGILRHA